MSDFDKAIVKTLHNEGGFVNDKDDPGGATNYGISLRFLKQWGISINNDGVIDIDDIKDITEPVARNIYFKYFWTPNKYSAIVDQAIAEKIFDIGVLHGATRVNAIAQACLYAAEWPLTIDGVIGKGTLNAINAVKSPKAYLEMLKVSLASSLAGLSIVNTNSKKYRIGWIERALS